MNKARQWSIVMALACFLMTGRAIGQATRPAGRDLVDQLLDQPAPGRIWEPANFGIPVDDAPVDQVLAFWTAFHMRPIDPSEKMRWRLLDACVDHADKLPGLLRLFPDKGAAAEAVNVIYQAHEKEKIWTDEQRQSIRQWVRRRSPHFRDELIAAARSVRYDHDFHLEDEEDLAALAKFDWATAEPILKQLVDARDIHVVAVALQMLAEHALASDNKGAVPELLGRLRKIADDRTAPLFARDRAFAVLESTPWEGRDVWYLSLFSELKLREALEDGDIFTSPLERLLKADPAHFVPPAATLLKSADATTRGSAAWSLVGIDRPDALRPLLPILSDVKNWPEDIKYGIGHEPLRAHLLNALCDVDVPESAAQILKAWPNLNDNERIDGALILAHFQVKEAPARLKAALAGPSSNEFARQSRLVEELIARNVLGDEETVAAIEAFCAAWVEDERRDAAHARRPSWPAVVEFGYALFRGVDQQKFAGKLLNRADALSAAQPLLADQIRKELSEWPVAAVDQDLLARIAPKNLDETIISTAIARLPGIGTNASAALRDLVQRGGPKAGFAAALLGDSEISTSILRGNDRAAQAMLLAVARRARTSLPLAEVAPRLDDKDRQISRAAESYLIAQDTPQSRRIVQSRHPGTLIIFGAPWAIAREPGQKDPDSPSVEEDLTERLRAEMQRKDGPDAIYAILGADDWGSDGKGQRIIRVRGERAVYSVFAYNGRTVSRDLSGDEFKSLLDLLAAKNLDELPNVENASKGNNGNAYLHLTRQTGRRIDFGYGGDSGSPYDLLTALFQRFSNAGTFTAHYPLQDTMPGLQVLFSSGKQKITSVWKRGNDCRVLIAAPDDEGPPPQWHAWRGGRLAEPFGVPPGFPITTDIHADVPANFHFDPDHCNPRFMSMSGDDVIVSGQPWRAPRPGLWRCRAGQEPKLIATGDFEFAHTVTTADGKWAVAQANREDATSRLVRVNLSDGTIHFFQLPPDHDYFVIARLPDDRIAASSKKWVGKDLVDTQRFVINAAAGTIEKVSGDFSPLDDGSTRPLQAAAEKDVLWAVETGETSDPAQIGKYDLRQFKFTAVVTLPGFNLKSDDVWVDEEEGMAYFCANGDLLRVPFRTEPGK